VRRQDGLLTARRTLAIAAAALLCGVGDVLLVLGSEHLPDPGVLSGYQACSVPQCGQPTDVVTAAVNA
jgi:hypothetical protein